MPTSNIISAARVGGDSGTRKWPSEHDIVPNHHVVQLAIRKKAEYSSAASITLKMSTLLIPSSDRDIHCWNPTGSSSIYTERLSSRRTNILPDVNNKVELAA